MTNDRSLPAAVIAVLLTCLVLTVFASWFAAALGLPIESLLSGEALRWFFRQPMLVFTSWPGECVLLLAIAAGAIGESGLTVHPHRHIHALVAAGLTLLLLMLLPVLGLFGTDAPLRSATGRIFPSPFLMGFCRALTAAVVCAAIVYGLTSRRLRTWSQTATLLFAGLQRYAPWLAVCGLAEILFKSLYYIFYVH